MIGKRKTDLKEIPFPYLSNILRGLHPGPGFLASLTTLYFFCIVRRQDSVSRCWGEEKVVQILSITINKEI